MALKCVKAFSWAHQGTRVRVYEPGQEIEADPELEPIAIERGWAKADGAATPAAPPTPPAAAAPANGTAVASKAKGGKKASAAPPAPSGGASAAGK